jgi:hypothetical protein
MLAVGGILVVLTLLVVPVGGPITNRWWASAWNLLHLPAFFILTRSFLYLFRGIEGSARRLYPTVALAVFVAVGSELVQMGVGRTASFHDLALNGFGIALGILRPARPDSRSPSKRLFCGVLLISALGFAFAPPLLQARSEQRWGKQLPVIGDFTNADCRRLWKSQGRTEARPDKNGGGLRLSVRPGVFGGVNYLPGEQDWSPYSELKLKIFNPGPPFQLGIRIDDHLSATDRSWISAAAIAEGGESAIVIPLATTSGREGQRAIDLARTSRLVVFLGEVENPVEFLIVSAVLR